MQQRATWAHTRLHSPAIKRREKKSSSYVKDSSVVSSVFIYVYFQMWYNFAMVPAHGLLFSNCTMGSLTCGLGGNPHTPSHAGCRVHPVPPGVALSQGANTEITVGTKLAHRSSGKTVRPDGNLHHQQWIQSHTSTFERIIEGNFFETKLIPKIFVH